MRGISILATVAVLGAGVPASLAQASPAPAPPRGQVAGAQAPTPLRLTLEDATRMALEHNLDLAVERLEPRAAEGRARQAKAAYVPSLTGTLVRSHQVTPPTTLFVATTNLFSSNLGVGQRLPWGGGTVSATWSASRQTSNSIINSFNPNLGSQLQLGLSQPLLRDLLIDTARQQLIVTKRNREITDTRFRETVVRTLADVKKAYWDLVAAGGLVDAQQRSLQLARELVRTNGARVEVGQAPPLDLVAARAEEAQREENLIVAEMQVRQAEDRLRMLVLDPAAPGYWSERLEPVDAPPVGAPLPDVEQVIARAIASRQDLMRARQELANAETGVQYYRNQRLPDVRLQAAYGVAGIAGTRFIRTGGFPGTISGSETTSFSRALDQVFSREYPSWSMGLSFSYPIGSSYEDAALANARVQESQARLRLQSLELKIVRQIRQAAWQLGANAKRLDTTRLTRELAEQRLDAEQKRFEVGMSTSFLVVQAQRDLAVARNNELTARLEYVRAIVDFEALQEAAPASSATGGSVTISGGSVVSMGTPTTGGATTGSGGNRGY